MEPRDCLAHLGVPKPSHHPRLALLEPRKRAFPLSAEGFVETVRLSALGGQRGSARAYVTRC
jgi:hypothetical protein